MEKTGSKRKSPFWIKLVWGIIIILLSSIIAVSITGYSYIFKTLVYTYPGIDDISLFNTRVIADEKPFDWPTSKLYNKLVLPKETEAELESLESVAYVVIKNDSILYERYWDHITANSPTNSFSMAKSIVGLLTGIAIADGKLSLYDKVGKYFPEYNNGLNSELTIYHLLTMSSGLDWDESYSSLFSPTTEAYYGSELERQILRLKVIKDPGTEFSYKSCNTVLLAMMISKATGKTISDYASEKLWKPLGAGPAYWSLDHRDGLEKSYCCFYSNARDFARVGQLMLDSGMFNGKQIVPKQFISLATSACNINDETGKPVNYYGFQFWLNKYNGENFSYARGILGQYIAILPKERIVVVRLGHKRSENKTGNHYDDLTNYLDGAMSINKLYEAQFKVEADSNSTGN